MNKEQLLEIFFNERAACQEMIKNCELYDNYLTLEISEPANFEFGKNDSKKMGDPSSSRKSDNISDSKSNANTLSMYSAFSRVSVDMTFYNVIITNRKKHNMFLSLEEEDINKKKWYCLDENQAIHGPFSTSQMNDFFILNKLVFLNLFFMFFSKLLIMSKGRSLVINKKSVQSSQDE